MYSIKEANIVSDASENSLIFNKNSISNSTQNSIFYKIKILYASKKRKFIFPFFIKW